MPIFFEIASWFHKFLMMQVSFKRIEKFILERKQRCLLITIVDHSHCCFIQVHFSTHKWSYLHIWNCCTYLQYVISITMHVNWNFICNKSKNFEMLNDMLNKSVHVFAILFVFVFSEGSIWLDPCFTGELTLYKFPSCPDNQIVL